GRSRLSQSVDQALVFVKRDQTNTTMEAPLHQIKGEVRAFDQAQAGLNQTLTSLDVSLSKMSMILEDHHAPNFEAHKHNFPEVRELIESDMSRVSKLTREDEIREARVVNSLKDLFQDFQTSRTQRVGLQTTMGPSAKNAP